MNVEMREASAGDAGATAMPQVSTDIVIGDAPLIEVLFCRALTEQV